MKRLKQASHDVLMTHASDAMKLLGVLINDPDRPAGVRADIGKFIYEQLRGKAKAHVDLEAKLKSAEDRVRGALVPAIMLWDGRPRRSPVVLEGEYTEDAEGDDRLKDAPIPPDTEDDEDRLPRLVRDAQADGRIL
ncbi:hypothetical protein [Micromonospora sp. RTGN7]|uniref:hypothetical protein n=1 Tax=Micromonospora sp. RTGN7 TaxID=3016526 RepID=UPI0029FEF922|nr:hypothetical protein [Micromonospora sp. RTGN7]